jgi:hypothetical protein
MLERLKNLRRDLLKEDQAILKELQTEPFAEKDLGILESYLAKIRRDGVPTHADMKQKLDALAENNTAVVTLIKAYAPNAKRRRLGNLRWGPIP